MLKELKIKIFADGANILDITKLSQDVNIKGFTCNPTLMKQSGVVDYKKFAQDVLNVIGDKPISFEVFADDFPNMERQAMEIASWDKNSNVYVKIPITNTVGESSCDLVHKLSHAGVKVNVTAVFTLSQVLQSTQALAGGAPSVCSVFAGRIFDAGVDAIPIMKGASEICKMHEGIELLWASPRQIFDVVQANEMCDIITVGYDILKKYSSLGKSLTEFSLDTVKMFERDAKASGYQL